MNTVGTSVRAAWRSIAAAALLACLCSAVHAGGESPRRGPRRGPWAPGGPGVPGTHRPAIGGPRHEGPPPQGAPEAKPAPPAAPAQAAPPPAAPKVGAIPGARGAKTIGMEVYDIEIDHLLRLLSEAAGVTIIKSDQVKGPVTVIAPEPVPIEEAFQVLNSVLDVRGFTMVQMTAQLYKVIPKAEAMQSAVPLKFGASPTEVPPGDQLITQVIPLKRLDAGDMAAQVQGLLSQQASVIPTSTNSLIITDTASRIQRVLTLIADGESQLADGFRVFSLQHYDATEMAQLVDSLILSRGGRAGAAARPAWEYRVRGAQPGVRQPVSVTAQRPGPAAAAGGGGPEFCYPDIRTNSLIVLATPEHLTQIEELTSRLDRPVTLRGTYCVYPVQNLVASELAQLVAPLVGAQVSAQGGGQPSRGGRQMTPSGQMPGRSGTSQRARGVTGVGTPLGRAGRGVSGGAGRSPSGSGFEVEPLGGAASEPPPPSGEQPPAAEAAGAEAPPEQVPPQPGQPAPEPGMEPEPAVEEPGTPAVAQAMITADDNANILLISAPPEQVDLIRQALEELDVLPPQVHIQAIIAEVSLTRDTSLGFQWNKLPLIVSDSGEYTGEFHTDFGLPTGDGTDTETLLGLFGQITGEDFEAVLTALTTDSHVRILATPSIFTSNNQQATIDVSKGIPFVTSTSRYEQTGSKSSSVEYKSVGIVLEVTPRVTQGNVVQMEVHVTSNELGDSITVADETYPSTNQRVADATLSIKDGYTIVLGGLMRDTIHRSSNKVPILGDLPILGSLFRTSDSRREKSELLVFLTPHVVRSPAEAAQVTEAEKSKLPEVPRTLRTPAGQPQ